ncbi:glycosyltransferase family 9 protein [Nonomuraea typhae]|uniref:glycosyltransferase family 9 protein n=1 Tax=Nonomuraea typhae TaxID=2603600 RepID=UPI0012F9F9A9|nr:glycosyltransferase family 9 protein [Nonomuraea typhae]
MALDVLVLRGRGLEGLLTIVPALRALRRAHPLRRIVLAAPARLAGLLPRIDAGTDLLDVSGPGPIPYEQPDIGVNFHGKGPNSVRALRDTQPGDLLSYGPDGPCWLLDVPEVQRWCDLLNWYGMATDPGDLLLGTHQPKAHVIVHPGASSRAHRWRPKRFAHIARKLGRQGLRVVVTGSSADRSLAARVAAAAALPPDQVAAGRTEVAELAELVRTARLVITGETGIARLAGAFATPAVVLSGHGSPVQPDSSPRGRHIVLCRGLSRDPGGEGVLAIKKSEVLAAAQCLLD